MARIKVEGIVDDLDNEIKYALVYAINQLYPEIVPNKSSLYKYFLKGLRKKCSTWEHVKDNHIEIS